MPSGGGNGSALQESDEHFRLAFNNSPIGKAIVAPEGQWLEVNRAICDLVGYSKEELLRMTFQEMTHPEDLKLDLALVQRLFDGEMDSFQMEKRYFHKEGGTIWVLLSTTLVRDRRGRPKYFVSEMQDITKNKQLGRALQEQGEHYRLALESAETGTWELDFATEKEIWSDHLYVLYGLSPEKVEPSYEAWLAHVHPDDRERLERSTVQLVESGAGSFHDEFRIMHPERGVRWMVTRGRILYEGRGQARRMVGTVADITDRKRNEAEKERLANYNYALLNFTGEGIYGIDTEGNCTFINRAAQRMLGYESEEVLGRNMHELIHCRRVDGSRYPETECPIYQAFRQNKGVRVSDDVLWRKDGTAMPVDYSSSPIFEGDVVTGAVVAFMDVSERKQAEEALAESEERYRRIYENAAVGVVQVALNERVIDVNDRLCEFLGYTREELLSLTTKDVTHPEDLEEGDRQAEALLRGEIPLYKVDKRYIRKDGSIVWAHLSVSLVRGRHEEPQYFVGVVEDITARVEVERVLKDLAASLEQQVDKRTADLRASNKELEAFAYSVSHDLRAPLRGIDGFSQVLLEEYSDRLDDNGRHYLERVRSGAKRMGDLINDLLELSRFSRAQLRFQTVDMGRVAASVLASLSEAEPERRVAVSVEEGLRAHGDERLLRIVLENLFGNAWKFTRDTEEPRIAFEGESRGSEMVFVVRDNGAGFDMEHVGRLFVPFQRLHRTSKFEGNGIGLATVQRIVSRHGGRVWAEAQVGRGANFYFSLPKTPPLPLDEEPSVTKGFSPV